MWSILLLTLLAGEATRELPVRIETVAGTGVAGYSGDGGSARQAQLNQPFHGALDAAGNLYLAEALNHYVRRLDLRTGVITTIAGPGVMGYRGDGGPGIQ